MAALREVTIDQLDEIAQLHTRIWKVAYRGMVPDEAGGRRHCDQGLIPSRQ